MPWIKQAIIIPDELTDEEIKDEEQDERLERIRQKRKKRPERGRGLHSTI